MFKSRIKTIVEDGDYALIEYTPSIFNPLIDGIDSISFVRRIRLLLEILSGGYKVYYLKCYTKLVAYDVLAPGGRRLKISTPNDLVSGPIFTCEEYRGRGYMTILKKMVIKYCCDGYNNIYSWIEKENYASIRVYKKLGYQIDTQELIVKGKLRRLIIVPVGQGTNVIFKYIINKKVV